MNTSKRTRFNPAGHPYGIPLPAELHEAIEAERGNLARAESLLGCLVIAMECEPDAVVGPHYPDVAQVARELVRQSINRLDSLTLETLLTRNKVKEDMGFLDLRLSLTQSDSVLDEIWGREPTLPSSSKATSRPTE